MSKTEMKDALLDTEAAEKEALEVKGESEKEKEKKNKVEDLLSKSK